MNYADDDNDSVEIPNVYDYQLHLNNYLPTYHLGSDPDTDEATPMLGRHPMPFPSGLTSPDNPTPRYDDSCLLQGTQPSGCTNRLLVKTPKLWREKVAQSGEESSLC